jgi:hypothetical protein
MKQKVSLAQRRKAFCQQLKVLKTRVPVASYTEVYRKSRIDPIRWALVLSVLTEPLQEAGKPTGTPSAFQQFAETRVSAILYGQLEEKPCR